MNIAVLISTFNGAKHIQEQLDSLLNQTFSNFHIYFRDDGSVDNTLEVLNKYREKHPNKISIIQDEKKNLRPAKSFMHLLSVVDANYYFFCDQDDVWKSDKIEICLKKLQSIEAKFPSLPILVHTDAELVDENLCSLGSSLWKQMHVHPKRLDNKRMLPVCYTVTGCTMAINKIAKRISMPMPVDADMHDNWIAYKVCQNGIVYPIEYTSMYYRQHSQNAVGILGTGMKVRFSKLAHLKTTFNQYLKLAKFYARHGYGSVYKWFFYKFIYFIIR